MRTAIAFGCGFACVTVVPWLLLSAISFISGLPRGELVFTSRGLGFAHLLLPVVGGFLYWVGERAVGWQIVSWHAFQIGMGVGMPFAYLLAHSARIH